MIIQLATANELFMTEFPESCYPKHPRESLKGLSPTSIYFGCPVQLSVHRLHTRYCLCPYAANTNMPGNPDRIGGRRLKL